VRDLTSQVCVCECVCVLFKNKTRRVYKRTKINSKEKPKITKTANALMKTEGSSNGRKMGKLHRKEKSDQIKKNIINLNF